MRRTLGYLLSPIHYLVFIILLLVFHPIQWISLKLGGYRGHKQSVDLLNYCLMMSYYLLGNTVHFTNPYRLPTDRPILFVSNHQSMYDIPPLIYHLRKHHAKFISKIELTKGIPSISFNLKHGGGANIDRKDSKQSVAEILKLSKRMRDKNWSAVIFPEGTRARSANIKPFAIGGIATIVKKVPNLLVVPVAINNSWKMVQYGTFPLNTFTAMQWTILEPIEPGNEAIEDVVHKAEAAIRDTLNRLNN